MIAARKAVPSSPVSNRVQRFPCLSLAEALLAYQLCWSPMRPSKYAFLRSSSERDLNSRIRLVICAAAGPEGTRGMALRAPITSLNRSRKRFSTSSSDRSFFSKGRPPTTKRQVKVFADSAPARPSYQRRSGRALQRYISTEKAKPKEDAARMAVSRETSSITVNAPRSAPDITAANRVPVARRKRCWPFNDVLSAATYAAGKSASESGDEPIKNEHTRGLTRSLRSGEHRFFGAAAPLARLRHQTSLGPSPSLRRHNQALPAEPERPGST